MQLNIKRYIGVFFGVIYALFLRIVFNISPEANLWDLFSVTYVWIAPIVIGLIPLLLASPEQIQTKKFRITIPVITIFLFFIFCNLPGIHDILFYLFILFPFLVGALVSGFILGRFIPGHTGNRTIVIISILLVPFIASIIEQQFKSPSKVYTVKSTVIINSSPGKIWENIIRIREIQEEEIPKGFFNYAGIPRPLYAELDKDTSGATHIGHFENGLSFIETVTVWDKDKQISFDIKLIPSPGAKTVFDEHILKGNHFKIINATYQLKRKDNHTTELNLTSSYQLTSKINGYASFCGNTLLADFQDRLLLVIKRRCDR